MSNTPNRASNSAGKPRKKEVTLDLTNLVRRWRTIPETELQRAIVLRVEAPIEGAVTASVLFHSSEAAADLRPRLRLSYIPRVDFGVP